MRRILIMSLLFSMQPDNYILVKFISKFTSKNFKDTIIIEIKESTTLTGNDKKKLLLE